MIIIAYTKWSTEKIINDIRKLRKKGEYIDSRSAINNHNKLYNAAQRYYGNWYNALRAAGIDPQKIKHHKKRTPQKQEPKNTKIAKILEMIYYISNYPGMTADILAEKLGVSRRTIVRYINAIRTIPGIEVEYINKRIGYDIRVTEGGKKDISRYMHIWTSKDMRILEYLTEENVPDEKIAQLLGRTAISIREKRKKMKEG